MSKHTRKEAIALWMAANWGALTRIAGRLKVTPQFVHQVLRGQRKSRNGRVERQLKDLGAPIQ